MKHTKWRLALVICSLMLVAFAIILLVFNIVISNYIQTQAYRAISIADSLVAEGDSDPAAEDDTEFYHTPAIVGDEIQISPPAISTNASFIQLNADYSIPGSEDDENVLSYYSWNDRQVIKWCTAHQDQFDNITYENINNQYYYIMQALHSNDYNSPPIILYYVDVTSEQHLVQIVDTAMLIVMFLCAAGACLVGIRVGKGIEHDQARQKKFFENASHELKTPLMSIQGYAEGLESGVVKDQQHASHVIIDETVKMASLVDEILCLSRIESGEIQLRKEKISLADLIGNCLTSIEMPAQKRGLAITNSIGSEQLDADPTQLERAITNILSNAVRYAKSEIRITYHNHRLAIWDDGDPIPPNELNNIFERFYTGRGGNTGIGLSLTKEIIERHGWKIYAENSKKGTQFVIITR